MKVITIESNNDITNNDKVILDFYANWCGPCKNLSKTLDMMATEDVFDDLVVAKVNIDQHSDLASEYNVRSLPTMVFLSSKKIVKTKVGNISKVDLETMIRETYNYAK